MKTLTAVLLMCAVVSAQSPEEKAVRIESALSRAKLEIAAVEQVERLQALTAQMQLLAETLIVARDRMDNPAPVTVDAPSEFGPTPLSEIAFQLRKSPRLTEDDVVWDPGAGDARWLIQSSLMFDCRGIGYEIDEGQAELARQLVADAGLSDKIEIIHGDALDLGAPEDATVAVCYMRPDLLEALQPELSQMRLVISYLHEVPGLAMTESRNSYKWERSEAVEQAVTTETRGRWVTRNVPCSQYGCGRSTCTMLVSKQFWEEEQVAVAKPQPARQTQTVRTQPAQTWYYQSNSNCRNCRNGRCYRWDD